MMKRMITVVLTMILMLVACGGEEETAVSTPSSASISDPAPTDSPTATVTAVPTLVPTEEPTAVPAVAIPTVAPTPIPTEESEDLASCIVGTWDYVNLQEVMQAMITDSMPPEMADQVTITEVNGRLFIIFGADGIAAAGAEDLLVSMAVMGTEVETAVEATGTIAYSIEGDTITTELNDYVSTGTNPLGGGVIVFDIATMLPAGETTEAISTFDCEGDSMQVVNPNLPIPLQLQRAD